MKDTQLDKNLPDMEYYFISGSLPNNYGGLTKSLLLRSKLFGTFQQRNTSFLTFGYDLSFRTKVERLYKKEIIDPAYTQVVNLYDDFLADVSLGKRTYEKRSVEEIIKLSKTNKVFEKIKNLFSNQNEKLELNYQKDKKHLKAVLYFNQDHQLMKKEEYAEKNRLASVSYYELGEDSPYLVEFINNDQLVYLEKRFTRNPQTEEYSLSVINWYSDGDVVTFTDESDLRRYWIKSIQSRSNNSKLFLVDSRPQDKHVFEIPKDKNSYYAAIIHNRHYGDNKVQIKGRYKKLMSHRLDLDAIFFITQEQRQDMTLITGEQPTYFYTPHTIERELDKQVLTKEKEPHKAVIVSRLASMKNVKDAVAAFALVVKEIPTATLDIFGTGDEQKEIKKKIEELNMKEHIFLKGHTSNPDAEFQSATLTISTSHFEGFGLSNMEALGNGCPVVTYDYDYGAKSMIMDGVNGYVVEQYNIQALASKIVSLMKDPEKQAQFAKNAFESALRYSPSEYIAHWTEALNQMIEQRHLRDQAEDQLTGLSFKLVEIPVAENQSTLLKFKSTESIPANSQLTLVGIDRRWKEEIVRVPILSEDQVMYAQIDSKHVQWETIQSNQVKKVDFYIELKLENNTILLKRVSSKVVRDPSFILFENSKLESYSTKYFNYSWSI